MTNDAGQFFLNKMGKPFKNMSNEMERFQTKDLKFLKHFTSTDIRKAYHRHALKSLTDDERRIFYKQEMMLYFKL